MIRWTGPKRPFLVLAWLASLVVRVEAGGGPAPIGPGGPVYPGTPGGPGSLPYAGTGGDLLGQGPTVGTAFDQGRQGRTLPPPALPPPIAPMIPPGKGPVGGTYTVVRGDSLWKIAERFCGSGQRWREIFQANRSRIRDPHWIYPGQVFTIPCGGGPALAPTMPDFGAPKGKPAGPGTGIPPGQPPGPGGVLPNGQGFLTNPPLRPGTYRISDHFGAARSYGGHAGIDLAAQRGTPIFAAGPGVVTQAGWVRGYGYMVTIRHPNGYETRYAHMREQPSVQKGQQVGGGTFLGPVNSTGISTGDHLHFEVRAPNGTAKNPAHFCRL